MVVVVICDKWMVDGWIWGMQWDVVRVVGTPWLCETSFCICAGRSRGTLSGFWLYRVDGEIVWVWNLRPRLG